MADADTVVVNTKLRSKKGPADEKMDKNKKRKASAVVIHQNGSGDSNASPSKKRKSDAQEHQDVDIDTSRPTAIFKPTKGRDWTVSIALPGSWTLNAKKPDHKTIQVGRIARAAAVFCVDEIVVFDDDPVNVDPKVVSEKYIRQGRGKKTKQEVLDSILEEDEAWQNPDQFLYHVLSFAECPPHLRYNAEDPRLSIFQQHQNLRFAGNLPSMDMPHHLRSHEWCQYREGVVVGPAPSPTSSSQKGKKSQKPASEKQTYAYVKCGLAYPVRVPVPPEAPIEPAMRTTVRFENADPPPSWPHLSQEECENLEVTACASSLPREESGYYWGYTVRRAQSLSAVFAECEYPDGYDYTIGTSERGVSVHSILPGSNTESSTKAPKSFKHLLIVFGGVAGLEPAVANDPELVAKGLGKQTAHTLFDAWVNLVPGQGSRTIRTEEAVEFGLCALKPWVDSMYEQ
ncbi:Nn.00g039020.m01.CDS01 [Neocucurbitaria sp. VM-36]